MTVMMNRLVNEITLLVCMWYSWRHSSHYPLRNLELHFKSKSLRLCITNGHTESRFHRQKVFIMHICQDPVYP